MHYVILRKVGITLLGLHYTHWSPLAGLDMVEEVSHWLTGSLEECWWLSCLQPPHTPLIPNFDYNLQQLRPAPLPATRHHHVLDGASNFIFIFRERNLKPDEMVLLKHFSSQSTILLRMKYNIKNLSFKFIFLSPSQEYLKHWIVFIVNNFNEIRYWRLKCQSFNISPRCFVLEGNCILSNFLKRFHLPDAEKKHGGKTHQKAIWVKVNNNKIYMV